MPREARSLRLFLTNPRVFTDPRFPPFVYLPIIRREMFYFFFFFFTRRSSKQRCIVISVRSLTAEQCYRARRISTGAICFVTKVGFLFQEFSNLLQRNRCRKEECFILLRFNRWSLGVVTRERLNEDNLHNESLLKILKYKL